MSMPKSPRQQMINIMYLVLIALLALNVSNEVIGAFKQLNKGLVLNAHSIDAQLTENIQSLKGAVKKNQTKKIYEEKIPEVEKIYEDLNTWISELQKELKTSVAPEEEWEDGLPLNLDDRQATTKIMIEAGKGKILQEKIEAARQAYLNIFEPQMLGQDSIFKATDQSQFENEMLLVLNETEDGQAWDVFNFNQMPLIAVETLLNKFKNDSKSTAAAAVKKLKNKVNKDEIPFDQFELKIVPNATKFVQGDKVEADVFLAASSSMSRPKIKINGRSYEVNEKGKVVFDATANSAGTFNINASAVFKDGHGAIKEKKQSISYEVVPPPNFAPMVSPTKMNVFYIGLENPITAGIIGMKDDLVTVKLKGDGEVQKASGTGNYTVNVRQKGDVSIEVSGTSERGEFKSYSIPFRTKRVPSPVAKIGHCSGCAMKTGEFKAQKGMYPELKDFVFDARFKIKGFNMMVSRKRNPDLVSTSNIGGSFNDKTKRYIKEAAVGDVFYFEDIKVEGPDGSIRKLPNITYRIM